MAKYTKVNSVDHLFELVAEGNTDFFIQLNFGARSSKHITPGPSKEVLEVVNLIDDTTQALTAELLMDESVTNIGKAIKYGAFWMEG